MTQNPIRQLLYHLTMGLAFQPPTPREPTPLEVAAVELNTTRHELLKQNSLLEYHGAMVAMLDQRSIRLREDIRILSSEITNEVNHG